jgi:hypothetical protein
MGLMIDALKGHLQQHGVAFEEVGGDPTYLAFGFVGAYARYRCFLVVHEPRGLVIFYSVYPVNVPEEKRDAVARLITIANYGMQFGNFEMDWADGEVRFKTSLWLEDQALTGGLTDGLIKPLMGVSFTAVDRYMPALVKVIHTDLDPREAVRQIEAGDGDDIN